MSEIINPNNMEDKEEDQNDIKARHMFVVNEFQSGCRHWRWYQYHS
jgi:hypothetical protein